MKFENINEVDLKLLLLGGDSINVDSIAIKPYKLREIRKYGYSNYMQNLQWISVSVDDFIENIKDEDKKKFLEEQRATLKAFDFYIKLGGQELLDTLLMAIRMIFRTDDVRVLDGKIVAINFEKLGIIVEDEDGEMSVSQERLSNISEEDLKVIHRENFDQLVNVVKLQNYLERPSSIILKEDNPADEETKKLMEHMKKMEEKVEARKKQQQGNDDEDKTDVADIISAVSSKSNSINRINIWNLTLYQLYDEYARLELIDGYDFSIKAMMTGAKKVNLKHWSSRL